MLSYIQYVYCEHLRSLVNSLCDQLWGASRTAAYAVPAKSANQLSFNAASALYLFPAKIFMNRGVTLQQGYGFWSRIWSLLVAHTWIETSFVRCTVFPLNLLRVPTDSTKPIVIRSSSYVATEKKEDEGNETTTGEWYDELWPLLDVEFEKTCAEILCLRQTRPDGFLPATRESNRQKTFLRNTNIKTRENI